MELTSVAGKQDCLVIVDKWVEAFPTSEQDVGAVVSTLPTDIIPR